MNNNLSQTTSNPIFYHVHTDMCLQVALGSGGDTTVWRFYNFLIGDGRFLIKMQKYRMNV